MTEKANAVIIESIFFHSVLCRAAKLHMDEKSFYGVLHVCLHYSVGTAAIQLAKLFLAK